MKVQDFFNNFYSVKVEFFKHSITWVIFSVDAKEKQKSGRGGSSPLKTALATVSDDNFLFAGRKQGERWRGEK